jgi:hypothetical protein
VRIRSIRSGIQIGGALLQSAFEFEIVAEPT